MMTAEALHRWRADIVTFAEEALRVGASKSASARAEWRSGAMARTAPSCENVALLVQGRGPI